MNARRQIPKSGPPRIVLAGLLLLVWYVAGDIYLYGQRAGTARANEVTADAAIVLGAGVQGDTPSPVFRERIEHGITLHQQGHVRWLIFTGGKGPAGHIAESVAARDYAIRRGVPAKAILTETASRITYHNLSNAQQVAEEHGLTTFLIVSDPLHLRRAVTMAHDLGLDAHPAPTPTTMYRSLRTQVPFLFREVFFYTSYRLRRFLGFI